MSSASRVIFVGNLPNDVRESEVEGIFKKFGKIITVDIKKPVRPPTFAFVEFDDPRDAADACRNRDGYDFAGERIRVELAKGGARRGGRGGGYGGGFGGGISRRSKFRICITGLPSTCSWQDLKDFTRRIGDVTYANVTRDRDGQTGVVDFAYEDDMRYAVKKLDDTEFERGYYIRVRADTGSPPPRERSRSPIRRRDRSRSRSPARSYSRSRSRSKSPAWSRSPAHSRSRSPADKSRSPSRSPARSRSP